MSLTQCIYQGNRYSENCEKSFLMGTLINMELKTILMYILVVFLLFFFLNM